MKEDTTILPFRQSEMIVDPLTELARQGARRMLAEALKADADAFVARFADEQLEDGRQRIVRHGFGPERYCQVVGISLRSLAKAGSCHHFCGVICPEAESIGAGMAV